jgi:hypothetical protein
LQNGREDTIINFLGGFSSSLWETVLFMANGQRNTIIPEDSEQKLPSITNEPRTVLIHTTMDRMRVEGKIIYLPGQSLIN